LRGKAPRRLKVYVLVFLRPRATIAATAMITITTIAAATIVRLELDAAAADVVVEVAVVGESVAKSGPLAPNVGFQ